MSPVVVVGSINADIMIEIERLPQRGETIAARCGTSGRMVPGGKGANQAAACARLGFDTSLICQFGSDAHAPVLQQALDDCNVSYDLASTVSCPSGQAYVMVEPNGENSIIIVSGANGQWPSTITINTTGNSTDECFLTVEREKAIQNAAVVLLQREIPDEINLLVAKTAQKANVPVFLDLGGFDTPVMEEVLPFVSFLCPNETELTRLIASEVEMTVNDIPTAIQASKYVYTKYPTFQGRLLITLGAHGAIVIDAKQELYQQSAFSVSNVVDTTGAGDCFRGVFAAMYSDGKTIPQALEFASAASALCIQTSGAMPSLPPLHMIQRFLTT